MSQPQHQQPPPSKMHLMVRHRDFTYEELQAQSARLDLLKHESEDEDEEVEGEGEGDHDKDGEVQESDDENEKANNSPLLDSPPNGESLKKYFTNIGLP